MNFFLQIERIQNPSLYQQYAAKRAHIEQHVDQSTFKVEQELWHGASSNAIVSINYYGFNRSYCGNNGKLFLRLLNFLQILKMQGFSLFFLYPSTHLPLKEGAYCFSR